MPGQRLLNRVAVVTGASQGIGREICNQFHLEGASIVCADVRPSTGSPTQNFTPTHEMITQQGGKAIFVKADVSKAEDVENLITAAVAEYGRVDIIVNNAGIFPEVLASAKPIDSAPSDVFEETFRINTRGAFLGAKYAVAQMKTQEPLESGIRGWIVNIASTAALVGVAGTPGYTASKGAIVAMTRSTAVDVGKAGIVCNCIAPGCLFEGMLKGVRPEDVAASFPMRRLGKPVDIARAAVFFASDDAAWVTGVTLAVDGGATAQ